MDKQGKQNAASNFAKACKMMKAMALMMGTSSFSSLSKGNQKSTAEDMIASLYQRIDPFGVTTSILNAQTAWLMHPQEMLRAISAMSSDVLALQAHLVRRAMGRRVRM